MTDATSPNVVPRVLVFFDYACQFCYLDWPRFKQLRAEHEVDVFLIPFELRPTLDTAGVDVSTIGAPHSDKVMEHMQRMAREGGLTLRFPSFVPNTHKALAVGEYARDAGTDTHEAVHEAIFRAYNADARDIGETDVLLGIAGDAGLDVEDVAKALEEGRYDERLHQFYHLALSMGISATPSALICNELLIGSRPYQVLEESVRRCVVTHEDVVARVEGPAADDLETEAGRSEAQLDGGQGG